jgi:hypothetical protein
MEKNIYLSLENSVNCTLLNVAWKLDNRIYVECTYLLVENIHSSICLIPTGIVTSTRITHATPAATYSRVANRRWECNRSEGMAGHGCPDIAEQLVHHNPGKNIKVKNELTMFGGHYKYSMAKSVFL